MSDENYLRELEALRAQRNAAERRIEKLRAALEKLCARHTGLLGNIASHALNEDDESGGA